MKNIKEKINISLSIDPKLAGYMEELFDNKSKYIEWLIEQDLTKNEKDIEKIIL